ncbi:hypothetical protein ACM26V_00235 [Salipaludibacillus sp. HK11]|uniref:hypothetical protein n=1 Tax=Salipaludibacillus sp. HK11 TaxID=3394320 RepID=UPI0039FCCCA7
MKVHDRVYVDHFLFEGWGTITDIFKGEILPFAVTLDIGDESGHRFKRVSLHEMSKNGVVKVDDEPKEIKMEQLSLF